MILAKSASRYSGGQTEGGRDRVHQVDVEADDLAARILELVGRVGNVHPDDQLAGRLDVLGHGVGDVVDLGGLRGRGLGRRARGIACSSYSPTAPERPTRRRRQRRATSVIAPDGPDYPASTLSLLSASGRHPPLKPMTLTTMDPARIAGNGTVISEPHRGRRTATFQRRAVRFRSSRAPAVCHTAPMETTATVLLQACCRTCGNRRSLSGVLAVILGVADAGLARQVDPGRGDLLRRLPADQRHRAGVLRVQPARRGRRPGPAVHQRCGVADPGGAGLPALR